MQPGRWERGGGTVPARGSALSALITRHSLGGIGLGESQAAVERLTGSGPVTFVGAVRGWWNTFEACQAVGSGLRKVDPRK